jgi:hypothetical protein
MATFLDAYVPSVHDTLSVREALSKLARNKHILMIIISQNVVFFPMKKLILGYFPFINRAK